MKKKNAHFEMHMSRMKQEYEQLRASLEEMDGVEREYVRRNAESQQKYNALMAKMQNLKLELDRLQDENTELSADLRLKEARDEENRKKINKMKDN